MRRPLAAISTVVVLLLLAGSVLGGSSSGELALKFPVVWSAGGAVGKKFLVRAGVSGFPLVVSGWDVTARSGFYAPGTRLAVFRSGRMLGITQAGSGGLSALLSSPVPDGELVEVVEGMSFRAGQVAYGAWHSLVPLPDGRVVARGANHYGQLGDGTVQTATSAVFVKDPAGGGDLTGVVQVAAGTGHSLALLSDGRVVAWGRNQCGQLGDGTTVNRSLPVFVLDPVEDRPLEGVVQVASYADSSFALLRDGRLLAWGDNYYGTLGDASRTNRSRPVFVKGVGSSEYLTGVLQVAPGGRHTLALLSDGQVAVWGVNTNGQLGQNKTYSQLSMNGKPLLVVGTSGSGTLTGVVQVAAGYWHSVALLADGRVVAWGGNGSGQLGNNSTTDRTYPGYVWGVGGSGYLTGVTAVASGGYHSLAVLSDGRVVSWGSNDRGELGNGASGSSAYRLVPGYVLGVGGTGQLVAVWVTGKGQSCAAVVPDGGLTAWGSNSSGMLGDGTTVDRLYPVPVNLP